VPFKNFLKKTLSECQFLINAYPKPNQTMEKPMTRNVLNTLKFVRAGLVLVAGATFVIAATGYAQDVTTAPAPGAPAPAGAQAEVERVIVTGSNIPTAEETGPNPVDTYRTQDIEKLGVRNATDLLVRLPQEAGGTITQNIANGGDGSVIPNLRGLLPKETLVLIDGKRVAPNANGVGVDINLIPFAMIDHIDILKDGASAVYGADAVAGVINIFLKHSFRGLELGGSIGNTNLGASNDAREADAWMIAGTGDDKTDIVIIAEAYDRQAIFSHDRDLSSNGDFSDFAGPNADARSGNFPGRVHARVLMPGLITPTPHSAPNAETSPEYVVRGAPGLGTGVNSNRFLFNFAAFTPAIPENDRQSFYASFTRDICDKYLTVFADFKYTRTFFNAALAPTPFTPDPFHTALGTGFSAAGISVPISNPFNPFTVADDVLPPGSPNAGVPVTTGVRYRSLEAGNRVSPTTKHDMLFDGGLKGNMGEFGDYFKTWEWEAGFRYSRNEAINISRSVVSQPGLREALLDTDPATAFNPFLNYGGRNTKAAFARVYVTLHDTSTFELPLTYLKLSGDLFNLPAGPVSFALGGEYHGERYHDEPDSLNTTFNTIGSVDFESSLVNRDVWGTYQEVRVPVTSPSWNFPGAYSLEINFAEREEWYSQNTSATTVIGAMHSQYDAQKPKVSVRYQPLRPEWIGTLTLRGAYTEAFHAPTLFEISPASQQSFPAVTDPFSSQTEQQVEERQIGNPNLQPEVAYEWTYGAVYSPGNASWAPRWLKGLTLSADFYHIDLRSIASLLGAQFIISHDLPGLVTRGPTAIPGERGPVTLVIDPNDNLAKAVLEGIDYEAVYILDTGEVFGHDIGRFTATVNGTYSSRFILQVDPNSKRFSINGQFVPTGFSLTSSIPRDRANFSLFYDGPADTWLAGFDTGAVVHWIGQYDDDILEGFNRKVREWITLDLIASYSFNLPAPAASTEVAGYAKDGGKNVRMKDGKDKNVMPVSTAEYNPCGWRAWLNGTRLTVGLQNATDEDPPFVAGAFENGYDESLTDIRGRFWYVQLTKRF
jgi:iron complex outermembrane receptor protein